MDGLFFLALVAIVVGGVIYAARRNSVNKNFDVTEDYAAPTWESSVRVEVYEPQPTAAPTPAPTAAPVKARKVRKPKTVKVEVPLVTETKTVKKPRQRAAKKAAQAKAAE